MEDRWSLIFWHIEFQELLELVSQLCGPLFGTKRSEGRVLQRILDVGKGVKLEELASTR